MSLLSRLLGKTGPQADAEAVTHQGFRIIPSPVKEVGGYRVSAQIEKEIGGQTRTHVLIRADTCQSRDEAVSMSAAKAKQAIDQLGDSLFE